jgi:hypothetical protein
MSAMPPPLCAAILSIHGSQLLYGGLSHTRPIHSDFKPSCSGVIMFAAVVHGMTSGQQGSVSNGPSSVIICLGVSQVSVSAMIQQHRKPQTGVEQENTPQPPAPRFSIFNSTPIP